MFPFKCTDENAMPGNQEQYWLDKGTRSSTMLSEWLLFTCPKRARDRLTVSAPIGHSFLSYFGVLVVILP
jgi:hypothetical protein